MKPTGHGKRTGRQLSACLRQQLDSYALAATAAGVGLLVLNQSAEARIVYTPANRRITVGTDVFLDLDHDGRNDFKFHVQRSIFPNGTFLTLNVCPTGGGDEIWGEADKVASALPLGHRIGGPKNSYFSKSENFMAGLSATSLGVRKYSGPWANGGEGVKNRYLGLKFITKGHTHFGWARLDVRISYSQKVVIDAVVTGYAYETIPSKPIITGKTNGPEETGRIRQPNPATLSAPVSESASLGALALGAPGLSIWRRETTAAARSENH
jgi:hypothetical protein